MGRQAGGFISAEILLWHLPDRARPHGPPSGALSPRQMAGESLGQGRLQAAVHGLPVCASLAARISCCPGVTGRGSKPTRPPPAPSHSPYAFCVLSKFASRFCVNRENHKYHREPNGAGSGIARAAADRTIAATAPVNHEGIAMFISPPQKLFPAPIPNTG